VLDTFLDHSRRRLLGGEPVQKPVEFRVTALDFQYDAARIVADPAPQVQLMGQPVDEGTEPDPLDRPSDLDSQPWGAAGRP